jgi:hypothetical protein
MVVVGDVEAGVTAIAVIHSRTGEAVSHHILAPLAQLIGINHVVLLAGVAGGGVLADLAVGNEVAAAEALSSLQEVVALAGGTFIRTTA